MLTLLILCLFPFIAVVAQDDAPKTFTNEECKLFGQLSVEELNAKFAGEENKSRLNALWKNLSLFLHSDKRKTEDALRRLKNKLKTKAGLTDSEIQRIINHITHSSADHEKMLRELNELKEALDKGAIEDKDDKERVVRENEQKRQEREEFLRTMKPGPNSRFVGMNYSDVENTLFDQKRPLPIPTSTREWFNRVIEHLGATTIKHQLRDPATWDKAFPDPNAAEDNPGSIPAKLKEFTPDAWKGAKEKLSAGASNWQYAHFMMLIANIAMLIGEPFYYVKNELKNEIRKVQLDFSLSRSLVNEKEQYLKSWWNIIGGTFKRKPKLRITLLLLLWFTWRQANYNSILAEHAAPILHHGRGSKHTTSSGTTSEADIPGTPLLHWPH